MRKCYRHELKKTSRYYAYIYIYIYEFHEENEDRNYEAWLYCNTYALKIYILINHNKTYIFTVKSKFIS